MADTKWYPSHQQLDSPQKLELAMRQVLDRVYSAHDNIGTLQASVGKITAGTRASQVPVANAAVTNLLGLPVLPSDTTQLADGATLKYNKKSRNFSFQ